MGGCCREAPPVIWLWLEVEDMQRKPSSGGSGGRSLESYEEHGHLGFRCREKLHKRRGGIVNC